MNKIKQILPQNFEIINGINYFRLEDGQIAVENTSNVTINSSKEDTVELITLEYKSKIVKFWRVNDKIYALASSSHVTIPEDSEFVDIYFSNNYPEGQYVKYISSGSCGILYVSETEIANIISHENGYSEICFENNLFYSNFEDGDNKYHVIGESGKLLGSFPSKCRKLDKYMLFYDENKIFIGSFEYEIPDGISSIEIVNARNMTFVKVVNSKGIYYYTKEIAYLFGPIQKDNIEYLNENSCFIHEIIGKKVTKVFYIKFVNDDTYVCKNISSTEGITIYLQYKDYFFAADNTLYVFIEEEMEFRPLIKDVDADSYTFNHSASPGDSYNYKINFLYIVGFKKKKPIYLAHYTSMRKTLSSQSSLDIICTGWEDGTYVCKKGNEIVAINENGKILFSATGKNCYKKKLMNHSYSGKPVYIVEVSSNQVILYYSNGEIV